MQSQEGRQSLTIKDYCDQQHSSLQTQRRKMIRDFRRLRQSFKAQNDFVKMQLSINSFQFDPEVIIDSMKKQGIDPVSGGQLPPPRAMRKESQISSQSSFLLKMQKGLRASGDQSPSVYRGGDESSNFRERLNSLRKNRSPSLVDPKDEPDVLHTAALDMTSNIV